MGDSARFLYPTSIPVGLVVQKWHRHEHDGPVHLVRCLLGLLREHLPTYSLLAKDSRCDGPQDVSRVDHLNIYLLKISFSKLPQMV